MSKPVLTMADLEHIAKEMRKDCNKPFVIKVSPEMADFFRSISLRFKRRTKHSPKNP